ncbi:MAG: T9SS type A sorting domain-containing protein, partial [Candidatus Cloacimonetes bacterium]|nr:T9SS type A sorting domain-containing protein [Candidatus Cloacimonadota bacterium]MCF7814298.1 T9SS type A sorting domain-containing protein [Candidatus Cloacimonadota bacterium]
TYNGTGAGNNLVALNELIGNYPNPFNPSTTIAFNLANAGHVTIDVYNIKGEKVRTLVDGEFTATSHTVTWDGIDDNNKQVSSGVYFYKMKADKYVQTKKMILMK